VLLARNVVIATGDQNRQVRPPISADLPAALRQVDSSAYRNAAELENGAVLVVGSGQSGGQIAEDLALAGRFFGDQPQRPRGAELSREQHA